MELQDTLVEMLLINRFTQLILESILRFILQRLSLSKRTHQRSKTIHFKRHSNATTNMSQEIVIFQPDEANKSWMWILSQRTQV